MSSRILITGGAGYIGSVLTPMLLQQGHRVTVLDSFMYRQNSLADCCHYETFDIVRGDARDADTLKPLLKDADYVLPLAALVGAPVCKMDRTGATSINRDAIATLTSLLSQEQRLIIPITNSGYGIGEKEMLCTEESPLRPISHYGVLKVEAEEIALSRDNALSFRFATVFGVSPRMRMDLLVNDFVYRAVNDRSLVIFEGHFKRNYLHVRDAARAFVHGIEHFEQMRGRPYNVGLSDANLSKIELCERIAKHVPGFVFFESAIGEDPDKRDYIVSNARFEATGWRPQHSLDNGIRELLKGYQILRNNRYTNI